MNKDKRENTGKVIYDHLVKTWDETDGSTPREQAEERAKKYREDLNKEEAINLLLEILDEITEGKLTEKTVEMAVVDGQDKEYRKVGIDEISKYISKVKKRSSEAPKKE